MLQILQIFTKFTFLVRILNLIKRHDILFTTVITHAVKGLPGKVCFKECTDARTTCYATTVCEKHNIM